MILPRRPLARTGPAFRLLLAILMLGLGAAGPTRTLEAQETTALGRLPVDATLVSDPAELSALLADRTVHATYLPDGTPWREFSAADGRTVWEVGGCLRPGTWRISGSVVCYAYPSWDDGRPQCFLVYRSPAVTHFVFLGAGGAEPMLIADAHEILDGNPDRLPIDLESVVCDDLNV